MMLCAVILNGVKNLEVSVAVDGSASLEILRCTQDDTEPTSDKVWGRATIFAPRALIFHFFCLYLREFIACVRYKYVRIRAQRENK